MPDRSYRVKKQEDTPTCGASSFNYYAPSVRMAIMLLRAFIVDAFGLLCFNYFLFFCFVDLAAKYEVCSWCSDEE